MPRNNVSTLKMREHFGDVIENAIYNDPKFKRMSGKIERESWNIEEDRQRLVTEIIGRVFMDRTIE